MENLDFTGPTRLLDEIEEATNKFNRLRLKQIGIQLPYHQDLHIIYQEAVNAHCDIVCTPLFLEGDVKSYNKNNQDSSSSSSGSSSGSNAKLGNLRLDELKQLFTSTLSQNVKLGSLKSKKRIDWTGFLLAMLPEIKIQNEMELNLKHMNLLVDLGIEACILDVTTVATEPHKTTPPWPPFFEFILQTLLDTYWGAYKMIIKMEFGPNQPQSLQWFKYIQKSSFGYAKLNLYAALRLQRELPSSTEIQEWMRQNVAYIFVKTDLFIGDINSPSLPAPHLDCILQFLERGANVFIEPSDEEYEWDDFHIFSDYIHSKWEEHLKGIFRLD